MLVDRTADWLIPNLVKVMCHIHNEQSFLTFISKRGSRKENITRSVSYVL